ncbi:MAG: coproporphyrinogen dehydrogenase HemZ [Ruminiclostridium sp.]|nr:coproporphyrinogen dehydrogenase HemZ [Ruminiclostridium sp.]
MLDFESELLDLIKLFFKDEEIVTSNDDFTQISAEKLLSGDLYIVEKTCSYRIGYAYGSGKTEYILPLSGGIPDRTQISERKTFKREIKRGIYSLLSKALGKKLPWGILTGIRPGKIVHELMGKSVPGYEIDKVLKDYYFLSAEKAELLYEVAAIEKSLLGSGSPDFVSIYIGIPFCLSRCLYCSFTSYSIHQYSGLVGKYIEALKYELASIGEMIRARGMKAQSIYIGGGTPTSLSAAYLKDLLASVEGYISLSRLHEYTLEAGRPDSIDAAKLDVIKNSAVDRISINPQTMNDETLKLIGRNHTSKDLTDAYRLARNMGFNNINMDVIVGLPGENVRMFEDTLKKIREMDPESMTVHTLALKRASRLKAERAEYSLVSELEAVEMINMARGYADLMGMHPYYLYRQKNMLGDLENTGYCKPGCESIYNVQIMEEKQSVIAAGAGAITKVVYPEENRIERAFNVKGVEEYIARIDEMIYRKKRLF